MGVHVGVMAYPHFSSTGTLISFGSSWTKNSTIVVLTCFAMRSPVWQPKHEGGVTTSPVFPELRRTRHLATEAAPVSSSRWDTFSVMLDLPRSIQPGRPGPWAQGRPEHLVHWPQAPKLFLSALSKLFRADTTMLCRVARPHVCMSGCSYWYKRQTLRGVHHWAMKRTETMDIHNTITHLYAISSDRESPAQNRVKLPFEGNSSTACTVLSSLL